MRAHTPVWSRLRLTSLAAACLLVVGACGGGGDDGGAAPGGDQEGGERPTTTTAPVPAPLTGQPLEDGAVARRPAVTVKVDNSPQGRPQAGLDRADVVIEEKVEGGITRFLVVFHSVDADLVGPVRSVRSTDAPLVAPLGGVFAFAGGIPAFEQLVRRAPVTVVSENASSQGFTYPPGKRRPFKTYTTTAKLRSLAKDRTAPPPRLFEFLAAGEAFAPPGSAPATHAEFGYGRTSAALDYDAASGTWKRATDGGPHNLANGTQLDFTNVIVQRTAYRVTQYRDTSGARVDEGVVVGSGDAVVLSQGKQVAVRWAKPSDTGVTTYTDTAGQPVRIPPGRTLVALVPAANPITVR